MPVHEYQCKDCGETFQIVGSFQTFIGLSPVCPNCKGKEIIHKFFAPTIIYKANGFYKTDNGEKAS